LAQELFERDDTVALAIPKELAERYHLAPGVEVEITAGDAGILLTPIGVPHWFSFEWERALDGVIERYGESIQMLREPPVDVNAEGEPETAPGEGAAQ
jgi:bifunctional DNA-binding transcriptional regulator/antitoxin component of YhaV-PrlF toxin-antitoxin module